MTSKYSLEIEAGHAPLPHTHLPSQPCAVPLAFPRPVPSPPAKSSSGVAKIPLWGGKIRGGDMSF